jgi:glycosyltransferase involved in cell wall biosynthesis
MSESVCVSVIIITYNQRQFIEQAVSSVLMQRTNFPFEILIGDDASTDGTVEILKALQEKHPEKIRLFLRSQNLGATRNAYELAMATRGTYIAVCEGDDYWISTNKLQKQVDFLERHPSFIGCSHDYIAVDQNGTSLRRQRMHWISKKRIYTLKDFKGNILPGQAATIVKRNIYTDHSLDCSICYKAHRQISDRTVILICATQGNFYHFKEKMSCYRRYKRAGNLTAREYSFSLEKFKQELDYTLTLENYAAAVLRVDANFRAYRKELFATAVLRYLRTGDRNWYIAAEETFADEDRKWDFFFNIPLSCIKRLFYRFFYLN